MPPVSHHQQQPHPQMEGDGSKTLNLHQVFYCRLSDHEDRVSKPSDADWIKFLVEKLFTELTC